MNINMSPPPKRPRTRPARTIVTRSMTQATSATTINDLFDDVLRETFEHMNASDLIVIADVCTKFRRNAQAEFASRYKRVFFSWNPMNNHRYMVDLHLRQLAPALRNFGQSIVAIGINTAERRSESWQIMDSIIKYGKSLRLLLFDGIDFTPEMVRKLQPTLLRLRSLLLIACSWTPATLAAKMLSYCPELNDLSIENASDVSDRAIKHLLAINTPLKKIRIAKCEPVTTSQMIESIVEHTPQIETIELFNNSADSSGIMESAEKLKRLTALKMLHIDCQRESFSPVLKELAAAGIPLKDLGMSFFLWDDEFLNEIMKWNHLEKFGMAYFGNVSSADVLTIVRNMTDLAELELFLLNPLLANDLVEVVQSAPKLRKFKFLFLERATFILEVDVFMQIRNIVKNRKSPGLLLVIHRDVKVDVPENVLIANESYLSIGYSDW